MYQAWLFLHLTGISIWSGSILAVILILMMMKKHLGSKELSNIIKKIVRIINMLVHPSAFIVLVSGIFMIVSLGLGMNKPFWLNFMEKFGGVVIMFSIIAISFAGRALVKKLNAMEKGESTIKAPVSFNNYMTVMTLSALSVFSTILVVAFKFM